jgi:hypothetical protein
MITIPTINAHPRHPASPYLGICTPANSQAWMSAAPCSTRTFLPSTVISISARTDAEAEKGRCWAMARAAVPRRTAPTALRRNIVPACPIDGTEMALMDGRGGELPAQCRMLMASKRSGSVGIGIYVVLTAAISNSSDRSDHRASRSSPRGRFRKARNKKYYGATSCLLKVINAEMARHVWLFTTLRHDGLHLKSKKINDVHCKRRL